MDQQRTKDILDHFRKRVIAEARRNLSRMNKNASKDLHSSLDSELQVGPRSFSLQFFMADYGKFVDEGVSGTERKYNTPYSYTTKMPPSKVFEKWVKQRGIQGRDSKGRFMTHKTLSFLIARSVFRKGIKPSLFFTKPFEREFLRLDEDLVEAFGLDIDEFLEQALNAD